MKWLSKREAKPDPIGDICRLLVGKAWEWVAEKTRDEARTPTLKHVSGVYVGWHRRGSVYESSGLRVFLGLSEDGGSEYVTTADAERLMVAIIGNAAARIARPLVSFDTATRAMAEAVLKGDGEAARQLADFVMEHCGGTKGAA